MNHFASLAAGSWLGMQIMAGYIAAPILFRHLDRVQAGDIAGELFAIAGYFGLAAWLLIYLLAHLKGANTKPRRWIALQIVLLAINQLAATPVINAIKHNTDHILLSLTHALLPHPLEPEHVNEFAFWHGFSSLLYMASTVLGLLILSVFLRTSFSRKHSTAPVHKPKEQAETEDFGFISHKNNTAP